MLLTRKKNNPAFMNAQAFNLRYSFKKSVYNEALVCFHKITIDKLEYQLLSCIISLRSNDVESIIKKIRLKVYNVDFQSNLFEFFSLSISHQA